MLLCVTLSSGRPWSFALRLPKRVSLAAPGLMGQRRAGCCPIGTHPLARWLSAQVDAGRPTAGDTAGADEGRLKLCKAGASRPSNRVSGEQVAAETIEGDAMRFCATRIG